MGTHLTTFLLVHQKSQDNNQEKIISICNFCRKSNLQQIETAYKVYFSCTKNECIKLKSFFKQLKKIRELKLEVESKSKDSNCQKLAQGEKMTEVVTRFKNMCFFVPYTH